MSDENMRVGSYGWKHLGWRGGFYPEDLPEDWELGYYSNEFRAVMVPQSYWCVGTGYDFGGEIDDIHEDFRFILEYPTIQTADEASLFGEQLDEIADYTAGIVFLSGQVPSADIHVSESIQRLPLYYRGELSTSGFSQSLKPVWQPEAQAVSSLAILDREISDLKQLRAWLEAFAGIGEKEGTARLVVCTQPDLKTEQLQQMKTLVEIMGL